MDKLLIYNGFLTGRMDYFCATCQISRILVIIDPMIKTTRIQFPNGNTLDLTVNAIVLLYIQAYGCVIVDQNGQLSLDFS